MPNGVKKKGENTFTEIMGNAVATMEQMTAYIKAKNPDVAQSVIDMIPLYLSEGKAEGVRGDIAFAQSCLETGNFGFFGSAVTLDQNNFCGMGVTSNGMRGMQTTAVYAYTTVWYQGTGSAFESLCFHSGFEE